MSPTSPRPLDIAIEAAKAGGALQRDSLGDPGFVGHKGERDLVTQVDRLSEETIVKMLQQSFPNHAILAEEGSVGGGDTGRRWIVDPLDGTTNFAHGLPLACVSIAFEDEGEVVSAVVYDPHRDELFTAERGGGSFLNGQAISVSSVEELSQATVGTAVPYQLDRLETGLELFNRVARSAGAVRILGSAALDAAYVAAGRFDAYWEHAGVHPWDVAAGLLLIQEAGGTVTDRRGWPLGVDAGEIVASNGKLHEVLLDLVGRGRE